MKRLNIFLRTKLDFLPHNPITTVIATLYTMMAFVFIQTITSTLFGSGSPFGIYTSIFQYLLIIVIAFILSALMLRRLKGTDLGFDTTFHKNILTYSVLISVFFNAIVFGAEYFNPKLSAASDAAIRSLGLGTSLQHDFVIILTILVFAPLWEEIVFRGLAFRAIRDGLHSKFKNCIPTIIALLGSSFIFMDAHGGEGQSDQLFFLFLLGVLLAVSYLYTGSLLTPILVHSFNNTYALLSGMLKQNIMLAGSISPYVLLFGPLITVSIYYLISYLFKLKSR